MSEEILPHIACSRETSFPTSERRFPCAPSPARCWHRDTAVAKTRWYLPGVRWVVGGSVKGSLYLWETECLDSWVHFYAHTCMGTHQWTTLS